MVVRSWENLHDVVLAARDLIVVAAQGHAPKLAGYQNQLSTWGYRFPPRDRAALEAIGEHVAKLEALRASDGDEDAEIDWLIDQLGQFKSRFGRYLQLAS